MKKILVIALSSFLLISLNSSAQGLLNKLKDKAKQRADDKEDKAMDKALDKTENSVKGGNKDNTTSTDKKNTSTSTDTTSKQVSNDPPSLKVYANYDFVPGDTILFEDNFLDDQDGEFPAHWDLDAGQAIINKIGDIPAFFLTEGNYAKVFPRMKTKNYLTDPFTVEFDYYANDGNYGPIVFLAYKNTDGNNETGDVHFDNRGGVSTGSFPKDFQDEYPVKDEKAFMNKWHHAAIIFKNNQLKCYVDQYRIMVMPNVGVNPTSFGFGGIGDKENPIIFRNVRVAKGGTMNLIGKKFTESKIVTHGINFDIDKATIKPESMGTLNMIVQVLKGDPDLKFEVDGHTDNTGGATHNLTLSQQRADAVKDQLIKMGIDASRLSTKGFGDTKPIGDNNTVEGKANNRRVEFVKIP